MSSLRTEVCFRVWDFGPEEAWKKWGEEWSREGENAAQEVNVCKLCGLFCLPGKLGVRGETSAGRMAQLGALLPASRHFYYLSHLHGCRGEIIPRSLAAQALDKPFPCPLHSFLCYFLPPRPSPPMLCTSQAALLNGK